MATAGYQEPFPSGESACDQISGRPVTRFELARHDVPGAETIIERLFEKSRGSWTELASDSANRVLRKEEGEDGFRYVVALPSNRLTSAIDVRRRNPTDMWSHGHVLRGRTLNCAFHHYVVTPNTPLGRLREQVEIRSTSGLITFYRHRSEQEAFAAASAQLDELMRELRGP